MVIYNTFKKVLSILNPRQKRNFFLLLVLMLFAGILETVGISLFIPIVYAITDNNFLNNNDVVRGICNLININTQQQFLFYAFILLGLIYILKNIYLYMQTLIQNNYVYNNRARFFTNIYSIYLNKDYSFFLENTSGDITRSIHYDVVYTFDVLLNFINVITEGIISSIILIFLFFVNWAASLIAGIVLLIEVVVIYKIIKPSLFKNGKIFSENSSTFLSNVIQSIESIKEIKVFDSESYFIRKNKRCVEDLSKSEKYYRTFSTIPKLVIESLTIASLSIALSILVLVGFDIKVLIPSLSAFALATIKLLPSLNKISSNLSNISYYAISVNNIVNLLNDNELSLGVSKDMPCDCHIDFNSNIEFNEVTFRYENSNKFIFENLNLKFVPNKSIGIVGGSGEGKTTLVDLLTGLLNPTSGEILCDGVNIKDNYKEWLSLIGYIPQSTVLINDSIRSNIAFGIEPEEIDEQRVISSLKDAQLYDFVCNMNQGLDTNIGERGVKLSGGQRQRIGIARALYKNPKILIFDEATSSLDNKTENEVMKSIDLLMKKNTIIIIAHRLTTIQNCDIIYKVSNGKVICESNKVI